MEKDEMEKEGRARGWPEKAPGRLQDEHSMEKPGRSSVEKKARPDESWDAAGAPLMRGTALMRSPRREPGWPKSGVSQEGRWKAPGSPFARYPGKRVGEARNARPGES